MTTPTLLPDVVEETVARIERLAPDGHAEWGRMTLPGMLAHCRRAVEVATGERALKRGLVGHLFGGFAKRRFVQSSRPFGRSSPTDPHLLDPDAADVERERAQLVERVRAYGADGPDASRPHPFFGRMTREEWDHLMWKHLDHHLRQFGV